jgi:hypothetical protein
MRSQSINILSGMAAFGVAGAGVVYLALLTLYGLGLIQSVSVVSPVATGVTLAAFVFAAYFVDTLMVYMSESYAIQQENLLRAEKAIMGIESVKKSDPEQENDTETQNPVYQEVIPYRGSASGEMVIERPLTSEELAWGQAIIKTLLHAWREGSIKSEKLSGKGKAISQPKHWVKITNVLRDMGMVSKDTVNGTEMLVNFDMAVEQVIPSLRRVSLPSGRPPRVAPPPQTDYKKISNGPHKTKD